MPRKKRTASPESPTPEITTSPEVAPLPDEGTTKHELDVFDQVIAARQAEATRNDEPTRTAPAADEGRGETSGRQNEPTSSVSFQVDPQSIYSVALADTRDAPRITLYRSRKFNQVAIKFDERPDEWIRERMHNEGYRWRQAEGVWTKQLGERRVGGQLAAERLVSELANSIRSDRGLAPASLAMSL